MGAPWNKWDWDYMWHALGGFAIIATIVWMTYRFGGPWWMPFIVMPVLLIGGVVREEIQHSWRWLSAHQWLEGILWAFGGLVAACAGLIFLLN